MVTRAKVLINQSFVMQRMTGVQRYATEISRRLLRDDHFAALEPTGRWSRSSARVWLWVLLVAPRLARRTVLLSLTSRAPVRHPRQVLVVQDLFVLTNPEWFSRAYVLTHAPLLRAQLRSAVAVVAGSAPVAEQVAPLFPREIVVAPSAPSEIFFTKGTDDTALTERGLVHDRYFLAVGSLDPRKNLAGLAAAYGLLSDTERSEFPLVVVGGGSTIFREQSIQWPAGTIDAGFITDLELRDLYAGARAMIFVSLAEGFGLPLVEAAAAGARSLVVSDIPVFRWICEDGARYVDPLSADTIALALREAMTEPTPLRLELSRFTWENSADVVRDLCRSLESKRS